MVNIYHITHITNLPSIIEAGGLWCDAKVNSGEVSAMGIAHKHIKERRRRRDVDLAPGGNLCDYVPFYFAPRSPMLYSIHQGYVEGYHGGQDDILHLEAQIEQIIQRELPFVFSDGHAEMSLSKFFNDPKDLREIDWGLMKSTYWNDTQDESDRKRKRQAEFLIHTFFPWELVTKIGVRLLKTQTQVQDIIEQKSKDHRPIIEIKREWYY